MPFAGEPSVQQPSVGALRASDDERECAVATLRAGAEHGRLTFDELAQRTQLAYEATTAAELERLVADLPSAVESSAAPVAPATHRRQRWSVAVMGGTDRRGRWTPAPRSVSVAIMGGVTLDLRDATIAGDELVITAFALMGGVDVIVPDGVEVQLSGFAIMGGNELRPGSEPVRPGTPVVHVRAYSLMGGVDVRVKRASQHT